MNGSKYIVSLGCGLILLSRISYSQTNSPPRVNGAIATATINLDPITGIFQYGYSVGNSSASTGAVTSFEIDITTTQGFQPSSEGLSNTATGYLGITSNFNIQKLGPSILPIGVTNSPNGWDSAVSIHGIISSGSISWSQRNGNPIAVGGSLSGFVLSSHGIPGIRRFLVEAYFDPTAFFTGIDLLPENQVDQAMATQRAARIAASAIGFTIGPVSPPSLTDPVQLTDFLVSLKHQSVSLGWISGSGSDGIVNSLDAKLSAAKAAIGRGQNDTAKNQLNAFTNELDAQRGKKINDNAYFLLKVNAQFIILKL